MGAKVASGELPIHALPELSDEQVIDAIVKVKGLGRWSAEMFLMFRLHRPDVLPVGDLGIVNAVKNVYRSGSGSTPASAAAARARRAEARAVCVVTGPAGRTSENHGAPAWLLTAKSGATLTP